ncbi:MAG: hypothetical protein FJ303_24035 [Planctomycetes bacterium]|nr:hypothetical protein [Planctomycetota bacterium]
MRRMNRAYFPCLAIGAVLIVTAIGCGPARYPVEGKVVYENGEGMPGGGTIIFEPVDTAAKSARGNINDDGTFKMGTFAEADGVIEGKYRVAIMPTPPRNPNKPPKGYPPIQKKYTHHEKSGLEITVTRGTNEYNPKVSK